MTNIREITINKNSIPADALISRSFKTGILYPSTSSPNFIIVFIAYSFVDINVYALISGLVTGTGEENRVRQTDQTNL